jgi:peptidoglycan/xylan/chitin deacetylase (PgdA/CDA1 family)
MANPRRQFLKVSALAGGVAATGGLVASEASAAKAAKEADGLDTSRLANPEMVQGVTILNYEEGGENSVLHGDPASEQFLSELFSPPAFPARHLTMDGIYEYGSRVGVWRILREFERRGLPLTVFGVTMALERCPEVTAALVELNHEIACHGWRWIHYQSVDEATERAHMAVAMAAMHRLTGAREVGAAAPATAPVHGAGWYTGRDSPNTRRLVADFGGFEYDSDYY